MKLSNLNDLKEVLEERGIEAFNVLARPNGELFYVSYFIKGTYVNVNDSLGTYEVSISDASQDEPEFNRVEVNTLAEVLDIVESIVKVEELKQGLKQAIEDKDELRAYKVFKELLLATDTKEIQLFIDILKHGETGL